MGAYRNYHPGYGNLGTNKKIKFCKKKLWTLTEKFKGEEGQIKIDLAEGRPNYEYFLELHNLSNDLHYLVLYEGVLFCLFKTFLFNMVFSGSTSI